MSLEPLREIYESDYGDELWFGGDGCGLISVGEWSAGGCKKSNPEDWAELHRQAKIIRASQDLLEALETIKRRMYEPRKFALQEVEAIIDKAIARAKGESS